jgi:GNAT superfamily N-acetyltransferase
VRASPSQAREVGSILRRAMDLPERSVDLFASVVGRARWHVYLALEDDRAIGAGTLFVHDGVGYLGMGATLPEHRKRGAQSALLARRLEVARDLGCSVVVSETGAPVEGDPQHSHRNMLRAGLREISVLHNFMPV